MKYKTLAMQTHTWLSLVTRDFNDYAAFKISITTALQMLFINQCSL